MSITKIVKQDIISSLKKNINEQNIEDYISEVKNKTGLFFNVKLIEKGYKLYESFISFFLEKEIKLCGFGRSKYEALSNAFINTIDNLLDRDQYVDPVKDSLKLLCQNNSKEPLPTINFSKMKIQSNNQITNNTNSAQFNLDTKTRFKRKNKSSNFRPNEIITNDNEESETKALVSMLTNDKQLILCHEEVFSVYGEFQSVFDTEEFANFKSEYQEKTLIIYELEKMVLDMMQQMRKLAEVFESETETYPDYFKCPISWEKLENPVVSIEGHSYEKWAIDKWLINQDISPITGLVLNDLTLIYNYALKSAIDDYNKKLIKWKRTKNDLNKYLTKSEYDLNDLKKYFDCKI